MSIREGRLIYVDAADLSLHDGLLAQVVRLRHRRAPADPEMLVRGLLVEYVSRATTRERARATAAVLDALAPHPPVADEETKP